VLWTHLGFVRVAVVVVAVTGNADVVVGVLATGRNWRVVDVIVVALVDDLKLALCLGRLTPLRCSTTLDIRPHQESQVLKMRPDGRVDLAGAGFGCPW
jgi:hypothetical protein